MRKSSLFRFACIATACILATGCAALDSAWHRVRGASSPPPAVATGSGVPPLYTEPPLSGLECHDRLRHRATQGAPARHATAEAALHECMGLQASGTSAPPPPVAMGAQRAVEYPPQPYRN